MYKELKEVPNSHTSVELKKKPVISMNLALHKEEFINIKEFMNVMLVQFWAAVHVTSPTSSQPWD